MVRAMVASITVDAYLAALPEDRRAALTKVRALVRARLPAGFEEGIQFGMISWSIPLTRYPETYNKKPLMVAALASQTHHLALYLMHLYQDAELMRAFRTGFEAAGKKLDMGKSCIRFRTADALALDVIDASLGKVTVEGFIAAYERSRRASSNPVTARGAANAARTRRKQAGRSPKANKPDKSITPKAKAEKRRHVKRK